MQRYIVTIQGRGFDDIEEMELLAPPEDGEVVETKYGSCIVTSTEPLPESNQFDGKIACRLP